MDSVSLLALCVIWIAHPSSERSPALPTGDWHWDDHFCLQCEGTIVSWPYPGNIRDLRLPRRYDPPDSDTAFDPTRRSVA